ncbi:MAG TPA: DJ-1/PfpI family protein, partial [Chitinophagaceae bacterium]|nr:DJ-1/PfpI family protein [Chitinophagaceae bacterium]
IAPKLGTLIAEDDTVVPVNHSLLTAASVLYDAVYVPGGINSIATLEKDPDAVHFLNEAYRHCKAIAADESARQVLSATGFAKKLPGANDADAAREEGVIISGDPAALVKNFAVAIAGHRFWDREPSRKVPA